MGRPDHRVRKRQACLAYDPLDGKACVESAKWYPFQRPLPDRAGWVPVANEGLVGTSLPCCAVNRLRQILADGGQ